MARGKRILKFKEEVKKLYDNVNIIAGFFIIKGPESRMLLSLVPMSSEHLQPQNK